MHKIISVIEIDNRGLVKTCVSFPIEEPQLSQEIIQETEDLFIKLAVENGLEDDDEDVIYDTIENQYYQKTGYSVNLVYS